MEKGAINYGMRVMVQRVLGLVLFWLGASVGFSWQVWVYFGTNFAAALVSLAIMLRINQETLSQRGKVVTDSPAWDKWLLGLYWLLHFFVIHLVAGLEWQGSVANQTLYWVGMLFVLSSILLALAALIVNTYLESTARIQGDRDQKVVSTGIYSVVRHPTYLAVLVSALGISLVFATPYVCWVAVVIAIIIVLRTYLEDRMLQEKLDGYLEYTQRVRYRLFPGIW
ncbi:MAG TPA: isoprenylcysteine carboxylmethyltransferase family protein [Limnochordia bacterium]|nr:isoprenylcysteine carboxylmethyltransferase family protein [Limnochordia bacterium]